MTTLYTYWPRVQNLLWVSQGRSASTSPVRTTVASSILLTNQHISVFHLLGISWNYLFTNNLSFQILCCYKLTPLCVCLSPKISTGFLGIMGVYEWAIFEFWVRNSTTCFGAFRQEKSSISSSQRGDISGGYMWRRVVPSRMVFS